jgi:hypothetical protein
MAEDIFKFKSPDMINLQKWMKKKPREFNRATASVLNNLAFQSRLVATDNIQSKTQTRDKKFVSRSLRVTKTPLNKPLNTLVASMGSIDISGKGRSDGFESLETGGRDKRKYTQTIAARGGKESRKVAPRVRLNKSKDFHTRKQHRGSAAIMLRKLRQKKIARKPVLIDRKVRRGGSSPLRRMKPGIYVMTGRKLLKRVQTFGNTNKRTKRIQWMKRATTEVMKDSNLKKQYKKEIDWIFRKR